MASKLGYKHLGLWDWPFNVVPVPSSLSFMADRHVLASDIQTLLRNLSRRSGSSMHLMWAWYGSVKSHTLQHIQYLCSNVYPGIVPVYLEFPRGARGFVDLYREFIVHLPKQVIDDAYLELATNPEKAEVESQLQVEVPDLLNALKLHYMGTAEQQETVRRWLLTDVRDVRTMRSLGLTRPLTTTEDCVKCMSWLLKIISLGTPSGERRVFWMIDEFQRVEDCRRPARDEINGALNSVFNRAPSSLSIVISFSGRPSSHLPEWLSKDLADRIGIQKVLVLPPLTGSDAVIFVHDLLSHYRLDGDQRGFVFPFSDASITAIIEQVNSKTELRPRAVIHFFNAVLEEADLLIEEGRLDHISPEFAINVLKDRTYLESED